MWLMLNIDKACVKYQIIKYSKFHIGVNNSCEPYVSFIHDLANEANTDVIFDSQ